MENKTINIAKLVETLNTMSATFTVTIPHDVTANLFKHLSDDVAEGAKGGSKKEYDFNSHDIDYTLVSEIYPLTNQVYISVRRVAENTEVFSFNHVFSFVNSTTATDKEVKMNNIFNRFRVDSFRKAAEIIEKAYDFEDWRCDGTVQKILEMLEVDQPKFVMANDLEKVTLKRVEFINSYKGIKVEITCGACASTLIIKPSSNEERDEKHIDDSIDDSVAKPFYFDTMFSGVKNAVNGIRAKAFFKNIASAETPIEAWNLTKAYLKEDTTLAGRFGHKNSMIEYSFEFDKADATAEFVLSIVNKVKCKDCNDVHPKPMFQMSFVIDDENIETIFDSVKSVMEMVK